MVLIIPETKLTRLFRSAVKRISLLINFIEETMSEEEIVLRLSYGFCESKIIISPLSQLTAKVFLIPHRDLIFELSFLSLNLLKKIIPCSNNFVRTSYENIAEDENSMSCMVMNPIHFISAINSP